MRLAFSQKKKKWTHSVFTVHIGNQHSFFFTHSLSFLLIFSSLPYSLAIFQITFCVSFASQCFIFRHISHVCNWLSRVYMKEFLRSLLWLRFSQVELHFFSYTPQHLALDSRVYFKLFFLDLFFLNSLLFLRYWLHCSLLCGLAWWKLNKLHNFFFNTGFYYHRDFNEKMLI